MQSVGQQIREQRLRLGLKLDEVSARSRISLKMLQAIEADDVASVGAPFLYRSFVRQFAQQVKLDYEVLAATVDATVLSMPQPRMPGEEEFGRTNLAPLPIRGRERNYRWLYSVASLGLMLVACSSLYGVWQNSKTSSKPSWSADLKALLRGGNSDGAAKVTVGGGAEASPSSAPKPAARPVQRPATPRIATPGQTDDTLASRETKSDAPAEPLVAQNPSEFRVEVSALERTWISIIEDGKETFSGVLDPEEKKVLEGDDTARIRTGNAGGINCVFNGKSIGPLGPRGTVRTVVFTKSNYEVLDTPARIALTRYPTFSE